MKLDNEVLARVARTLNGCSDGDPEIYLTLEAVAAALGMHADDDARPHELVVLTSEDYELVSEFASLGAETLDERAFGDYPDYGPEDLPDIRAKLDRFNGIEV